MQPVFNFFDMKKIIFFYTLFFIPCSVFGQNWEHLNGGLNQAVYSLFSDSTNHSLFISGGFVFTKKDSLEVNGIANWKNDKYSSLNTGIDNCGNYCNPSWSIVKFNGEIHMDVHQNNISGVPINSIARWDEVKWDSLGNGVDGTVFNLEIKDNKLWVMGEFETVGNGVHSRSIAKWDGVNWIAFEVPILEEDSRIYDMIYYEGNLYLAGNFRYEMAGKYYHDIIVSDGEEWKPAAGGLLGGFSIIQKMIIYKDELYIGGSIWKADGNHGSGILKLKDGAWVDVGGSFDKDLDQVWDMLVWKDELYVFGLFDSVGGGVEASNIAKWDGERWCSLGSNFESTVTCATIHNDSLFVGGWFKEIDGEPFGSIAKWAGGDFVSECGPIVSSVQEEIVSKISIFPNPAINQIRVNINLNNSPTHSITLTLQTLSGNILLQKEVEPRGQELQENIDVSGLPKGVYLVSLEAEDGAWVEKVVVQ